MAARASCRLVEHVVLSSSAVSRTIAFLFDLFIVLPLLKLIHVGVKTPVTQRRY